MAAGFISTSDRSGPTGSFSEMRDARAQPGPSLSDITTANFDFIQSYRPLTNVVRRPTENGAGQGYSITGHHELNIPLLAALLDQNAPQT